MSVSAIPEEAGIISRLQLAKALKEDPENINAESPESSAIFLRQRSRNTKFTPQRGTFYIPRPINLLVPPVLGNEGDNKTAQPNNLLPILNSNQAIQQVKRPGQPQVSTSSPRNSFIIPEERRGSTSKPATLLDVRQSMLEAKHNLHNATPFSTSSSHRTSVILQQHKSSDVNGKLHGASKLNPVTNSRPNSLFVPSSSSRPTSSYSLSTNSRPTSTYKSNENENENENEIPKSKKSKEIKKSGSASSNDSDSASKLPPILPQINSVTNQSITLEKVDEEDGSSDSLNEGEDDDDSSEDDTPLALKSTPRIKVAPPKIITTRGISGGGRIETWLEDVSGSPPSRPSTPSRSPTPSHSPTHNHSPTRSHSPRIRKTSEHSHGSSPLGRMSYIEPIHDSRNRRPKSALVPDDIQVPKPDFNQPRKRCNSEFAPRTKHEKSPSISVGRVSPNPRQDSGYWAKDTLIALSDDLRHISIMNDSNPSNPSTRRRSSSLTNVNSNSNNAKLPISKVINRHRREGSGSRPSTPPQLHIPPQGNYLPSTIHPSRSRDSLYTPPMAVYANRNSLYINNNIVSKRISSEQLMASNRSSAIYLNQNHQKHRIRS